MSKNLNQLTNFFDYLSSNLLILNTIKFCNEVNFINPKLRVKIFPIN